jgi:hypothetical protein
VLPLDVPGNAFYDGVYGVDEIDRRYLDFDANCTSADQDRLIAQEFAGHHGRDR